MPPPEAQPIPDIAKTQSLDSLEPERLTFLEWEIFSEATGDGIIEYPPTPDTEPLFKGRAAAAAELGYPEGSRHKMEDRLLINRHEGIFGVFDGLGGHAAGQVAATIAACTFHQEFVKRTYETESVHDAIVGALAAADTEVGNYGDDADQTDTPLSCATVAVAIEQTPEDLKAGRRRFAIASVGDTRAYLVTADDRVEQLTRDDRLPELEDLSEIEMRSALGRSVVTFVLGGGDVHERAPQYREITLNPGEQIILSSDGIHDVLAADSKDVTTLMKELQILRAADNLTEETWQQAEARWESEQTTLSDLVKLSRQPDELAKNILAAVGRVVTERKLSGATGAKVDNRTVLVIG